MICGILKGGLGNQLFQYAATRNLAHLKGTNFTFDTNERTRDKERNLSIQHFFDIEEFKENTLNNSEPERHFQKKVIKPFGNAFRPWFLKSYIKEKEGESLQFFAKFPANCTIDGYWQNIGFFEDISDDLRDEFAIVTNPLLQNYVAVHFRGGDYLEKDKKEYHGNATEQYYLQAFEYILKKNPQALFHLFSDTPQYFHFPFLEQFQTVWQPVLSDVEDLKKMATYQNFIIANSSFSWWAAWLGAKNKGLVICPALWYKDKRLSKVSPALKDWIKLTPW